MNQKAAFKIQASRFLSQYGMLVILILLGVFFSILTIHEQQPSGKRAAESIARQISQSNDTYLKNILIIVQDNDDDRQLAALVEKLLSEDSTVKVKTLWGSPAEVKDSLTTCSEAFREYQGFVTTQAYRPVVQSIKTQFPLYTAVPVVTPLAYRWPTFLLASNIRNVANQITVIAIIAIGMTMVIITSGIDLSVGSLIALSAVVTAWLVERMGGIGASPLVLLLGSLGGMALCGGVGAFSGLMITRFNIPPFIATLAMMQVAAGLAYIISRGLPIYQLPENFVTLGRGNEPFLQIPYAVLLMAVLYILAHLFMARTVWGRYVYAVGGNSEAARLAGIRVKLVTFFVYTLCGVLAGLGGVIMASQLKSGAPTYGLTYELYVIAAVVVGGTSLSGGEGRIFGTLIGAFIIAVIQNGMNLTNVESYTQKVILGVVILLAVLLDRMKQQGFKIKKVSPDTADAGIEKSEK